jgi:putative membrane protein
VPATIQRSRAAALAHREFSSRILADPQHRNGILFFVSLGERYVQVMADPETHARINPDVWDKLVADFIAAVKADRLTEGAIAAINACGALLVEHYPITGAREL